MAKKKAELDAQLRAMEEKFAKENDRLRRELKANDPSAAQSSRLQQMDARKRAMETYKSRVKIHLAEYKRELIRLEEALKTVRGRRGGGAAAAHGARRRPH